MASRRPALVSPAPPAVEAWRWISVLHARLVDQLESDARTADVVPFSWFEVLAALDVSPDNRVRCKDLADAVLLTRAGVSRLLDRIEAAGLLRREDSPTDGRGSDAVLTSAGSKALRRAAPVYAKTIHEHFGKHLTGAQSTAMIAVFRRILAANDWLPDARPVPVTIGKRK
jgi:DNA-binding MarR family transcriptional regulator